MEKSVVTRNLPRFVIVCLEEIIFITLTALAISTIAGANTFWEPQQARTIIIGAVSGMVGVWGTSIVEKLLKVRIGLAVDVFIAVDLLLSVVMGEACEVFLKIQGYDKFLHAFGTLQLALVGYVLSKYILKKTNKGGSHHLLFAIIFGFFFALGVQMLWELYEFSFDMIAGTNMQKYIPDEFMNSINQSNLDINATQQEIAEFYQSFNGYHYAVEDTMWDIVADIIGASAGVAGAAVVFHYFPKLQDSLLCDYKDIVEEENEGTMNPVSKPNEK